MVVLLGRIHVGAVIRLTDRAGSRWSGSPVPPTEPTRRRLAAPLRPGSYDFARDLYFQGIGATGLAVGEIKITAPPRRPSLWLRYAAVIESMRDGIDRRIRAAVPGDAGSIASALITGKRDAISKTLNDAMYISSLAHVLSISG